MRLFISAPKHGFGKSSILWELVLDVILKLVRGRPRRESDHGRHESNEGRAMVMDRIDRLILECGSDTFTISKSTILRL
jgi:hypothetical protein